MTFSGLAVLIVVWTAAWRTRGGRRLYRRTKGKLELASSRANYSVQTLENYIANSGVSLGAPETDERYVELASQLEEIRGDRIQLQEELDRIRADYPGVGAIEWLSFPCRAVGGWIRRMRVQKRRDEFAHVKALADAIEDLKDEDTDVDALWLRAYWQLDSQDVREPLEYGDITVRLQERGGQMTVSQGDFAVAAGFVLRPFSKRAED
ncbi:MAG: hypothetical protein OXH41_06340 [Chloroflexi bacterium]|nr:hypothetical protein [Chloroflexota bacterium]